MLAAKQLYSEGVPKFLCGLWASCVMSSLAAHRMFDDTLRDGIIFVEDWDHVHPQQVLYCSHQILLECGICIITTPSHRVLRHAQ